MRFLLRWQVDCCGLISIPVTWWSPVKHKSLRSKPSDPQLLNPRELASAEARERAADAALKRAAPGVAGAKAEVQFAEAEMARLRKLVDSDAISASQWEAAQRAYRTSAEAYRSATFAEDIARFELEQARAALLPSRRSGEQAEDWRFRIASPINGKVLRVFQESTAVVVPGAPLLEVGDPTDLELEVDVLSSDAVKIQPGQRVIIQHWGGGFDLTGVVRLVEPSAFTKIFCVGCRRTASERNHRYCKSHRRSPYVGGWVSHRSADRCLGRQRFAVAADELFVS